MVEPTLNWRAAWRPALQGWIVARLAVFLGFMVAHGLSGRVSLPNGRLHLDQGLMTWDGTYYRVIAEGWYGGAGTPGDASRFFPTYPGLGRLLSGFGAVSVDIPLLILSNLAALLAAVVVWQLAQDAFADRAGSIAIANRAAWMTAIIPAANVYVFAYSESLMLLISTAALLYLGRKQLWLVAALGLAAGLLRPGGVLLVMPVAIAAFIELRDRDDSETLYSVARRWVAPLVAPLVGLLGALTWINSTTGDFFAPMRIQRELRDGFRDPISRLAEAAYNLGTGHLHDIYNFAFAMGFLALILVGWKLKQPPAWIGYLIVTWIVAVGGNNMDSVGRYCVVAAPFTIALALWAQKRWQQIAVWSFGALAIIWFTSEVMLGRIIP